MNIPILRFEIDHLRQSIQSCFLESHSDLKKRVLDTIDKTLNEQWVQNQIQSAVNECMREAINDLCNNAELKYLLTKLMSDKLQDTILQGDK